MPCTANIIGANTKVTSVSQASFLDKVLHVSCARSAQLKNGQASCFEILNTEEDSFSGQTVFFLLDFHHPAILLSQ